MNEIDGEKLLLVAGDKALELEEELHHFSKIILRNFDLRIFFENPAIPKEAKKALWVEINPQASNLFRNLIYLLIDEELEKQIVKLSERFTRLVSQKKGIIFAEVTSAYPLSASDLKDLERSIGGEVHFRIEIDPHLIGGIKVLTSEGNFFDASLLGNLKKLKESLVHV